VRGTDPATAGTRIGRMTARIGRIATTGLDAPRAGPKEHSRSRTDLGAAAKGSRHVGSVDEEERCAGAWISTPLRKKILGSWMERRDAPVPGARPPRGADPLDPCRHPPDPHEAVEPRRTRPDGHPLPNTAYSLLPTGSCSSWARSARQNVLPSPTLLAAVRSSTHAGGEVAADRATESRVLLRARARAPRRARGPAIRRARPASRIALVPFVTMAGSFDSLRRTTPRSTTPAPPATHTQHSRTRSCMARR
jgi:hypothetical protein